MDKYNKLLGKARLNLLTARNSVFLSTLLYSLKFEWNTDIPTAATNGTKLLINPNFFESLNIKEQVGLLAHEIYHVALLHPMRRGSRDPKVWNIAADMYINSILESHNFKLPKGGIEGDSSYLKQTTEQIYDNLLGSAKVIQALGDNPMQGDIIEADDSDTQEIMRKVVAASIAQQTESAHGSLPGELAALIDNFLNPRLPWTTILRKYMTSISKDDQSWVRPNRRFADSVYMPIKRGDSIGKIAWAFDVSGSVTDEQFARFISETRMVQNTMNPKKTTILTFDTCIQDEYVLSEGEQIHSFEFHGRGGTDLEPVFEYFSDKEKPDVLIVFSDLYCPQITERPPYNVIWICIDNPSAEVNFGKLIHITD